jgi:hypothetical protein
MNQGGSFEWSWEMNLFPGAANEFSRACAGKKWGCFSLLGVCFRVSGVCFRGLVVMMN